MNISINKKGLDPNAPYKLSKDFKYNNNWYKDIAKEYDEISTITNEVAQELKEVCDFDNYIIGIHRTGYTDVNSEVLDDIFNNGLINNGHIMQGAQDNYIDLERTVSIISDFTLLIGSLKSAHNYKGSQGVFLVKIPKDYLDDSNENKKPIYFHDGLSVRLLPEYIHCYIPSDKEGNIKEIIKNKNYSDIHDYKNDGLLYEGSNRNNRSK